MSGITYAAFIELEKAFDRVDWKILFEELNEIGIDWRYKRLILNLYKTQSTEKWISMALRKRLG